MSFGWFFASWFLVNFEESMTEVYIRLSIRPNVMGSVSSNKEEAVTEKGHKFSTKLIIVC